MFQENENHRVRELRISFVEVVQGIAQFTIQISRHIVQQKHRTTTMFECSNAWNDQCLRNGMTL